MPGKIGGMMMMGTTTGGSVSPLTLVPGPGEGEAGGSVGMLSVGAGGDGDVLTPGDGVGLSGVIWSVPPGGLGDGESPGVGLGEPSGAGLGEPSGAGLGDGEASGVGLGDGLGDPSVPAVAVLATWPAP